MCIRDSSKPDDISRAGMKVRAQQLLDQGVRVIYHDHINFEIQGVRSVKQGKGDFATREIRFTRTAEVRQPTAVGDGILGLIEASAVVMIVMMMMITMMMLNRSSMRCPRTSLW